MVGAERASTIHEDVDLFFYRHVLRPERVVGTTMDAVVARVAETLTGGDECEGPTRPVLRPQHHRRRAARQREDDLDEPAFASRQTAGRVEAGVDNRAGGQGAAEPSTVRCLVGKRISQADQLAAHPCARRYGRNRQVELLYVAADQVDERPGRIPQGTAPLRPYVQPVEGRPLA